MELVPTPSPKRSTWIVHALGDQGLTRLIYEGPSRDRAWRACLEAYALARALPEPSMLTDTYHEMCAPFFGYESGYDLANEGVDPWDPVLSERAFFWAAFRDMWDGDERDECQGVVGPKVAWIDEHGARWSVEARLSEDERAFIEGLPAKEHGLPWGLGPWTAGLDRLGLLAEVAHASVGAASKSI